MERADPSGRAYGRARTRQALAIVYHRRNELTLAQAALEEAGAIAEEGAADLRGAILCDLAMVVHDSKDYAKADAVLEASLDLARASGDHLLQANVYGHAATMAVERAKYSEAEAWNQRALQAAEAIGNRRLHALAVLRGGTIAELDGDLRLATRRYSEGEVVLQGLQARSLVAWSRGARGRIALVHGDLVEAAALLPSFLETWGMKDHFHLYSAVITAQRGDAAATRAHVALSVGEPKGARLAELAVLAANAFAAEPGSAVAVAAVSTAPAIWAADPTAPQLGQVGDSLLAALERHAAGWMVASDGSWFRPPGAERTDLSKRRALARILCALTGSWRKGTGPLDLAALFAAGWPSEQAVPSAASNRVYVALSTLRDAGLGPVILRDALGWRLDPASPIHIAAP